MSTVRRVLSFAALALACAPGTALSNGLELLPGGPRSVARGGAVAARPEDPMLLSNNPAGLAYLKDNQFLFALDVPRHDMCVDPYGYYGWGVYQAPNPGQGSEFGDELALDDPEDPTIGSTYATTPLGKVCNSAPALPLPQVAWAGKVTDDLGMGFGLVAPVVVPGLQYGGADGTINTPYGPRPTPTRYSLIKQEVTHAFAPTFGIAYRLLDELAAGMSLHVIMLRARARQVQNESSGTQPSGDSLVTLTTQDFFVPAATFSLHARPVEALDLMAAFRISDDVRGSGDVVFETNTYHRGATTGPVPFENDPIALKEVTVRLPWTLTAGVRYAGLLAGERAGGDPIETELWDVEVDFSFTFNERAGKSTVTVGEDATVITRTAEGGEGSSTVDDEDLSALDIDRRLKDVYAIRAGGSFAVLPRKLALHAGGFYESRGVDPAYADVDTFAFRRIGFGLGAVLRIGDFDLLAGYGHIFSETLDVAPPPHENVENATPGDPESGFDQRVGGTFDEGGTRRGGVVLPDPDAPRRGNATARKTQESALSSRVRPERVINAGRYTAAFDIVSVGLAYHF